MSYLNMQLTKETSLRFRKPILQGDKVSWTIFFLERKSSHLYNNKPFKCFHECMKRMQFFLNG